METRRRLTVSGVLILTLVVALALATGFTLAQSKEPESTINEPSGPEEIAEPVLGAIPIQGRLTDDGGNALDGYHVITMSLYANSLDTTPLCQDDDSVNVEDGLFSTEMDWCSSSDIDGKRLYLGIQVEGDEEMSPRQIIYPVPYAYSLRPGAIISGSTSVAILHVENWYTSGRGLRVYAMSETGTNYGVVGASRSPDGYGGYFYNNGGGTGVYGSNSNGVGTGVYGLSTDGYGVYGESTSSNGVRGESSSNYGVVGMSTSNAGMYGNSSSSYGVYGISTGSSSGVFGISTNGNGVTGSSSNSFGVNGVSTNSNGVRGYTSRSDGNYGLYTENNLYSNNIHSTGAKMQVVQNNGKTSLEIGDVVAFSGIAAPLEADAPPIIQVTSSESANSTAIAGVVYSRYNIEAVSAGPEEAIADVTLEGPGAPGEYLLIVVQGPAHVKASALGGSLQPGDLVSSADQVGYAAQATKVTLGGVETAIPGTILGKVLEPLDEGEALIYIFVTLQ